jgi:ADP-heptose:LPS heptosyltransferase
MRFLVIRTSAMGDVALLTPVLRAVERKYPDLELVVLTRPAFMPFFSSFSQTSVFKVELKGRHKGIIGLFRLFGDLRRTGEFDRVIDLHDVMRSQVLRIMFSLCGVPSSVIEKGRKEKRAIIRGRSALSLKHSVNRYMDVFEKAGFPAGHVEGPWLVPPVNDLETADRMMPDKGIFAIGVAPFARHELKMWPLESMLVLLKMISAKYAVKFFLFGGIDDKLRLEALRTSLPGAHTVTGSLSLSGELALMSRLDLMIAMDSSNMHMAALTGTKVVSIWGATDSRTGFGAWMQPDSNTVSIPVTQLICRPCTIYGKGKCRRGDLACLAWLTPEMVFKRIEKIINAGNGEGAQ